MKKVRIMLYHEVESFNLFNKGEVALCGYCGCKVFNPRGDKYACNRCGKIVSVLKERDEK